MCCVCVHFRGHTGFGLSRLLLGRESRHVTFLLNYNSIVCPNNGHFSTSPLLHLACRYMTDRGLEEVKHSIVNNQQWLKNYDQLRKSVCNYYQLCLIV